MNYVKSQLSLINRINIFILKKLYGKKIKHKVKWYVNNSIKSNLIYTPLQIFTSLYNRKFFENFIMTLILLNYLILSTLYMILLLIFLESDPEIEIKNLEEKEYIRVKIESNSFEYKSELLNYNNSIYEDEFENDFFSLTSYVSHTFYKNYLIYFDDLIYQNKLNDYAIKSLNFKNAGGKSEISEAWSINQITETFTTHGYELIECIYEMNITYKCKYKMLDYVLTFKELNLGVSVTRAMNIYNEELAINFLKKKIDGLIISQKIISDNLKFGYALLHIFSPCQTVTNLLVNTITNNLLSEFDSKINIWVTTTNLESIYKNKRIDLRI